MMRTTLIRDPLDRKVTTKFWIADNASVIVARTPDDQAFVLLDTLFPDRVGTVHEDWEWADMVPYYGMVQIEGDAYEPDREDSEPFRLKPQQSK